MSSPIEVLAERESQLHDIADGYSGPTAVLAECMLALIELQKTVRTPPVQSISNGTKS